MEKGEVHSKNSIEEVPWKNCDVDYIIDATGVLKNVQDANKLIQEDIVKESLSPTLQKNL